jgi:hypothetical protein
MLAKIWSWLGNEWKRDSRKSYRGFETDEFT